MIRIAKPESFVLLSPSREDVCIVLYVLTVILIHHIGREAKRY